MQESDEAELYLPDIRHHIIVVGMNKLMVDTLLRSEAGSASVLLKDVSDEDLRKVIRVIDNEIKNRKRPTDDTWDVLCELYTASAGEVQENQIDMLRRLVQMIGDEKHMKNMIPSGQTWDRAIETFFERATSFAESDNDYDRLRHVIEAIEAVQGKSVTACIRRSLLSILLHATMATLEPINRWRRRKVISKKLVPSVDSQLHGDLRDVLRAGERLERLFGRNVGHVFFLEAGAASMMERKINDHAINALARYVATCMSPYPYLNRLASSVLSKLAKYFGWENWVFEPITWRFQAKSLIPNGLVKVLPTSSPGCLLAPATLCSRLDAIDLNLLEFYVYQLCPGRTFSSDNIYLELLPVAAENEGVLHALLTLSASYRKEYYSDQFEAVEHRETMYQGRTLTSLRNHLSDSRVSILVIALLMHYCMVNEHVDHCWSVHSRAANDLVYRPDPPSFFIAYQAVLARTACSLTDDRIPLSHEYEWLGYGTEDDLSRIDGTTGISRAVLYAISLITESSASSNQLDQAPNLERRLEAIRQTASVGENDQDQILMKTAESYRVAAQVYLQCRLRGATPTHDVVIYYRRRLICLVEGLPSEGPQYTAVHPLWSMFIIAISANGEQERAKIADLLRAINKRNKGNVGPAITVIEDIWRWQDQTGLAGLRYRSAWWEDMIQSLPNTSTTKVLSLG